jgi:predicted dehydrogenase
VSKATPNNGRETRRSAQEGPRKPGRSYRAAIVGARRGLHHARAYEGMDGMQVVALCELDPERLAHGVRRLGVAGYSSMEEMLEKERPDIVHAVAKSTVPRAPFVEMAAAAGVKALVIEKPIGLLLSEVEAVATAVERTGLKVVVNHQRRYMPFADRLR